MFGILCAVLVPSQTHEHMGAADGSRCRKSERRTFFTQLVGFPPQIFLGRMLSWKDLVQKVLMPQERKSIWKCQKPKAPEAPGGELEPEVLGAGQGSGSGLGLHGMEWRRNLETE